MKYRKGYKYVLKGPIMVSLEEYSETLFYALQTLYTTNTFSVQYGELHLYSGYAWDGASGPTLDTRSVMRASAFHDMLFQLLREGILEQRHLPEADDLFIKLALEDGLPKPVAWVYRKGLQLFSEGALKRPRKIIEYI